MGAHAPIATYGSEGEPQETQVGTGRRRIRHVRWDSPRFPLPSLYSSLAIQPWGPDRPHSHWSLEPSGRFKAGSRSGSKSGCGGFAAQMSQEMPANVGSGKLVPVPRFHDADMINAQCGGSEVRINLAASPSCGLLNQSRTGSISCWCPSIPKFANERVAE